MEIGIKKRVVFDLTIDEARRVQAGDEAMWTKIQGMIQSQKYKILVDDD